MHLNHLKTHLLNTPRMKKFTPLITLFAFIGASFYGNINAQNVGINTSGANPSVNAILDLNTGNAGRDLGFIVPNVTLSASLATFNPPIANAATAGDKGMLVYNSNPANQPVGYYYWNGATWVSLGAAPTVTGANNGLTMNGTNVQLGGANPLLGNTSIISGGNNLAFTGTGNFQLGSASTSTGTLQFFNVGTFRTVSISAGVTTASYNLTLPVSQGAANTVLTNNGAGVLSWGALTVSGANNGLTMNGTNIQLGGANPLLANTTINSGGFNLDFSGAGKFQLGLSNANIGTIEFLNNSNVNSVDIISGATTGSYTMTLPVAQGAANTVLTDNGAGILTWGVPAVGGANNGLTMNGTNVQLGGANPLLGNTTINSAGFNLAFAGTGKFLLGVATASTGTIEFNNIANANTIDIKAGATTGSYGLTLPLAQGAANTVLTNNGAGVLSWTAVGGGAANNGLTLVGGNTQLGGANPLLANTNILTGGFSLGITGGGALQLGSSSASTGLLQFYNVASPNAVSIQAGNTTAAYTMTLPPAVGAAGQELQTSNTGVLSWATPTAGGGGKLNGIKFVTSTVANVDFDPGTTSIVFKLIGGGGAGGGGGAAPCAIGGGQDVSGAGGGSGAYCEGFATAIVAGTTKYSVTIGAGGIGTNNCAVNSGGTTTLTLTGGPLGIYTAPGGTGGSSNVAAPATGAVYAGGAGGAIATGGSINLTGAQGGQAVISTTGTDGCHSGSGASTVFGNGGLGIWSRDINCNGMSAPANSFGAGGAGGVSPTTGGHGAVVGGNGAPGVVIIYEYQ